LRGESAVSFAFRKGFVAGLLCASVAAHAEYKEVWNPPEAAAGVRHHAAAHTAKTVKPAAKTHEKVKSSKVKKSVAKAPLHATAKPRPLPPILK
jgi:hypothetical protein